MDEGGFDFRKPSGRREARAFEPPPWEAEAFEELRKKREASERQDAEETSPESPEADAEPEKTTEEASSQADSTASPEDEELLYELAALSAEHPQPKGSETTGSPEETPAEGEPIDEGLMLEMLSGLAAEEPKSGCAAQNMAIVAGGALAVLGLGLAVWGSVAAPRVQGGGRTVTLVLVVMGLAYLAVGLGLVYRALKQRGVL